MRVDGSADFGRPSAAGTFNACFQHTQRRKQTQVVIPGKVGMFYRPFAIAIYWKTADLQRRKLEDVVSRPAQRISDYLR
jgi:hypothetical protein